jgi:bis(5'-nucleosidyl)-tetraphosphatase
MHTAASKRAAGFVLFERSPKGRRYLLLRNSRHGTWGFPKGHCNDGEDLLACARRELLEETSLTDVRIYPEFERTLSYRVRSPKGGWEKIVCYYLAEKLSGECRISDEHDQCAWMTRLEAQAKLGFEDLRQLMDEADAFSVD